MPQPYAQAQDGKTEMSLVHFSLTHPGWVPPQPESETFVQNLRGQAAREAEQLTTLTEEELAGELNRREKGKRDGMFGEMREKSSYSNLERNPRFSWGLFDLYILCFHQSKKC